MENNMTSNRNNENSHWCKVNDPETTSGQLEEIAGEATNNLPLLRRLAEHANLSPAALYALSEHEDHQVRAALADNPSSPRSLLEKLCRDTHADVRYFLAESYTLDLDLISSLLEDENPYVAQRARNTLRRREVHLVATLPWTGATANTQPKQRERKSG
jgi:hypothetical protein